MDRERAWISSPPHLLTIKFLICIRYINECSCIQGMFIYTTVSLGVIHLDLTEQSREIQVEIVWHGVHLITCANFLNKWQPFQLGIDIGSSTVARGVVSLVLGYLNNLVIEMAFLVQVKLLLFVIWFSSPIGWSVIQNLGLCLLSILAQIQTPSYYPS